MHKIFHLFYDDIAKIIILKEAKNILGSHETYSIYKLGNSVIEVDVVCRIFNQN